ncbi:hypothetical protein LIER_07665 [Lithospermum erythrorhizon]|uniref:Auxin-responsive protein n=1 Tax=Lithospermum erythrorhizon TaxID=34254 RepID=A0AAV3PAR6_LITER
MAKEGLGFEITELRLGLPGGSDVDDSGEKNEKKRTFSEIEVNKIGSSEDESAKKAQSTENQAVGWPPVCTHRRKNSLKNEARKVMYVKVSMDGAPFLRKIDLNSHKAYLDLIVALEKLFGCFGIGDDSSEYVPIYEDKDGDWMLVGDVPWEMFIETCKKLRIMKKSDARGMGLQTKDLLKGIIKEGSV